MVNAPSPFYKYQTPGMIDGIVQGGALEYGDIFTYHRPQNYGYQKHIMPEEVKPSWIEEIETFKEWIEDYGPGEMPPEGEYGLYNLVQVSCAGADGREIVLHAPSFR